MRRLHGTPIAFELSDAEIEEYTALAEHHGHTIGEMFSMISKIINAADYPEFDQFAEPFEFVRPQIVGEDYYNIRNVPEPTVNVHPLVALREAYRDEEIAAGGWLERNPGLACIRSKLANSLAWSRFFAIRAREERHRLMHQEFVKHASAQIARIDAAKAKAPTPTDPATYFNSNPPFPASDRLLGTAATTAQADRLAKIEERRGDIRQISNRKDH
jgi:hypothetical protein